MISSPYFLMAFYFSQFNDVVRLGGIFFGHVASSFRIDRGNFEKKNIEKKF